MNMAERLSRYFVLSGAAKEEDREVLAFMLFHIFALIQQILALAAVALTLNAFPQVIAFVLFFASLKRYAGGAHANKHWVCLTVSTGLTMAVCLLCKLVAVSPYFAVGASVIALALVILKSPVIHPNNPKPERKRRQMRKISICIAAFQCLLVVAASVFWPMLALPGALGGLAAAVSLVLPVPAVET